MKATPVLVGLAILCLAFAIPARADQRFSATLTGGQQVPAAASSGTGVGTVVLNTAETQITVNLSFSGLTSNATLAHIHGPAAAGANADILFIFSDVPAATSGSIPEQMFSITPRRWRSSRPGSSISISTAAISAAERFAGRSAPRRPRNTLPHWPAGSRCRRSRAEAPARERCCSTATRRRSSST